MKIYITLLRLAGRTESVGEFMEEFERLTLPQVLTVKQ